MSDLNNNTLVKSNSNECESRNLTLDPRNHSFNVGIAIDYSPTMALWLGHLAFWSEKNLANNKHIHDGLVWCYDTLEALRDYFPYFTKRQIERLINNSVELGLVKKGNYNQTQYDRTCWYALTPKALFYFPHLCNEKYMKRLYNSISPNGEMDYTIWRNGYPHLVTPIPNTDPNTDPNNIYISEPEKIEQEPLKPIDYEETYYKEHNDKVDKVIQNKSFELFWNKYPVKKNKARALCAWKSQGCHKIWEQILQKLTLQLAEDQQYIDGYAPSPANYIMQERWKDEIQKKVHKKNTQSHHHTDWDVNLHQDII